MAAYSSYPTGTPVGTDQVLYLSDPAGAPAEKLASVSDFGGGGGGITWTQDINESGASTTNFASYNGGTWSTDGTVITCVGAGSGSYYRHSTFVTADMIIVEADVKLLSSNAGDCYAGVALMQANGSGAPSHGDAPYVRIQRAGGVFSVLGGRTANDRVSVTLPGGAMNTWYTVRMVVIGSAVKAYVDGIRMLPTFGAYEYRADAAAFWSYNADASYRDLKVWTADLGLPA